jgi:hypothetical protein
VIQGKSIKAGIVIPAADLVGLVPPEPAPAGKPTIDVDAGGIRVRVTLNGKSLRRSIRLIQELGPDAVVAVLQGTLVPGRPGQPFTLDSAGLMGFDSQNR